MSIWAWLLSVAAMMAGSTLVVVSAIVVGARADKQFQRLWAEEIEESQR